MRRMGILLLAAVAVAASARGDAFRRGDAVDATTARGGAAKVGAPWAAALWVGSLLDRLQVDLGKVLAAVRERHADRRQAHRLVLERSAASIGEFFMRFFRAMGFIRGGGASGDDAASTGGNGTDATTEDTVSANCVDGGAGTAAGEAERDAVPEVVKPQKDHHSFLGNWNIFFPKSRREDDPAESDPDATTQATGRSNATAPAECSGEGSEDAGSASPLPSTPPTPLPSQEPKPEGDDAQRPVRETKPGSASAPAAAGASLRPSAFPTKANAATSVAMPTNGVAYIPSAAPTSSRETSATQKSDATPSAAPSLLDSSSPSAPVPIYTSARATPGQSRPSALPSSSPTQGPAPADADEAGHRDTINAFSSEPSSASSAAPSVTLCTDGLLDETGCICCAAGCGTCGGCDCGAKGSGDTGGPDLCCPAAIAHNNILCVLSSDVGCVVGSGTCDIPVRIEASALCS